ncbi:MAG: zinc-binding dehydrogenase [Streptosporangiaceae bacterium]|jgi:NADPH:quinone reductase-like Zn-dependent oxidoreductase
MTQIKEPVPEYGELLVKVEAFSVNRGETFLLEPDPPYPAPSGWRPGKDIAGLVVQAAAVSTRGDRLAALGAEVVREVPEGPFDVVLESTGGPVFAAALATLVPGGQLIWFGEASRQPVTIDFFAMITGPAGATITHFGYDHPPYDADLATLVGLVSAGKLHPEIGYQGSWDATADAITRLRDRRVTGNVVLVIA